MKMKLLVNAGPKVGIILFIKKSEFIKYCIKKKTQKKTQKKNRTIFFLFNYFSKWLTLLLTFVLN